jgi:hypothetical protein
MKKTTGRKAFILMLGCLFSVWAHAFSNEKDSTKIKVTGLVGIVYEGYRLSAQPESPSFVNARKPENLVRILFQPTISIGEFKLPFNFSFSPMQNNFVSPPFGFGNLPGFPKQSFSQWITNPVNNIGLNPSYKWIEIPLGTQYIKLSELSTGDVGAFGYGINLKPGKFRLRFFSGVNQQAYEPYVDPATNAAFAGTYKRTLTMAQIGLGKDGKYFTGFNIVRGIDDSTSVVAPMVSDSVSTAKPQENFIVSFVANFKSAKGWYGQTEIGTTIATRDLLLPGSNTFIKNLYPFITTNLSSYRDHAMAAAFGRKSKYWDAGIGVKWIGAGYYSMGYPFMQNDKLDYTINTRINAFKNKLNFVASIGQRLGNISDSVNHTKQLIANANLFVQMSQHLSLNANYNNFGFQTTGLTGVRNVGHDMGINPTYSWYNTVMSHLLSFTYNWSRYEEALYNSANITANNSHTAMLMYVPSFFSKPDFSTDASIMYYKNNTDPGSIKLSMWTYSLSAGRNFPKQKLNLKTQLQYNLTTMNTYDPGKNLLLTLAVDWNLIRRLTWNTSITVNIYKYGNELTPPASLDGARYFENTLKSSLIYRFGG